jgi:hypothetical protein
MNERLKQLAELAGMYVDVKGEPWPRWMGAEECEAAYAKFAELIVEKCAGIIESQDVDPSFKLRMSWAVKQYFGVEQ